MDEHSLLAGLYVGASRGLMADLRTAVRWPVAVAADVKIGYHGGSPEQMRLRIEPCAAPTRVAISSGDPKHELEVLKLVRWDELPGSVLYSRLFAVLAVHWFGSIDMPARIVGAPLWSVLSIEVRVDGGDGQALQLQLKAIGRDKATLQCRIDRTQPWITRTVLLAAADADPLRALLRHGIDYVRPTLLLQPTRPPETVPPTAGILYAPVRQPLQEVHP